MLVCAAAVSSDHPAAKLHRNHPDPTGGGSPLVLQVWSKHKVLCLNPRRNSFSLFWLPTQPGSCWVLVSVMVDCTSERSIVCSGSHSVTFNLLTFHQISRAR